MTGLDTNVLVRYLTQDDPTQAEKATQVIEKGADEGTQFFITSVVMCELIWVLESAYGYKRDDIASAVEQILRTRQFEIENKSLMEPALSDYREGKGDFSDHLVGHTGKQAGCSETLTFDKALKGSPLFQMLE